MSLVDFETSAACSAASGSSEQGGDDEDGVFHAHSCSFKLVGLMKMRMGLAGLVSADCSDAKGISGRAMSVRTVISLVFRFSISFSVFLVFSRSARRARLAGRASLNCSSAACNRRAAMAASPCSSIDPLR